MITFLNNQHFTESVVALGFFDGVHRGHAAIFSAANKMAEDKGFTSVALTFDAHPISILRPEQAPPLLTTASEKENLIRATGISEVVTARFNKAFASYSPEQFVSEVLFDRLKAKGVVCGYDYRFGAGGRGDFQLLESMGRVDGVEVVQLSPVTHGGEVVSSTMIRKCLLEGEVEKATDLLGHHYCLTGKVEHGRKRGRKMGFPTANLVTPAQKLIPRDGVYAVGVAIDKSGWKLGLLSIGAKPTFEEGDRTVEVYIDGEHVDLYGKEVTLSFISYLRGIVRYDTMDSLRNQISQDLVNARRIWSEIPCNEETIML